MTNGYEFIVGIIMTTEINFKFIQRLCSSYSEGNSLGLHYKTEQVNILQRINFIFDVILTVHRR